VCVCVCVSEYDQVQQQASTPTSRYKRSDIKKNELHMILIVHLYSFIVQSTTCFGCPQPSSGRVLSTKMFLFVEIYEH
jgi:hypothetical protein